MSQGPRRRAGRGRATLAGSHTLTSVSPPLPDQNVVYPVRIESSSDSLANGRTLDLNCLVASQAPHTITWYKRGGSLPSRHQVRNQRAGRAHTGGVTGPDGNQEELRTAPSVLTESSNTRQALLPRGPGPVLGTRRGVPLTSVGPVENVR